MSRQFDLTLETSDSIFLRATWYLPPASPQRIVVINSATGALRSLYRNFAAWLSDRDVAVLTYDNRGIGDSSSAALLRSAGMSFSDWGRFDYGCAVAEARSRFPDVPVSVLGHSIGGIVVGFCPEAPVERIVTVGAQTSYWRDWKATHLPLFVFQWGLVMPLATRAVGHFPGSKLGYPCDLPAGIAREWMQGSFLLPEFTSRPGGVAQTTRDGKAWRDLFAGVSAPIWAIAFTDDPIATPRAVDRGSRHFSSSEVTRLDWMPQDYGLGEIGHFGFVRRSGAEKLWPALLQVLMPGGGGRLPCHGAPGPLRACG